MNKKLIFTFLAIAFLVLIVVNIGMLNFDDLSFSENKSHYLGIVSNALLGVVMLLSRKKSTKNKG